MQIPRTLTPKFTIVTVAFLILLTLIAVVVINSITTVSRATDLVTRELTEHMSVNMHFHEDMDMISSDTQFYVLTGDEEYRAEVDEAVEEAQEALPILERMSREDRSTIPNFLDTFEQLHDRRTAIVPEWEQAALAVLEAADRDDESALAEVLDEFDRIDEEIGVLEEDADELIRQELAAANDTINVLTQRVIYSTVGGLLLAGLVAALMFVLLRSQVVKPIRALSEASTAFANGQLDQTVTVTNSDEIGDLQRTFNEMARSLREQQAMLEQRTAEAERMQAEREALQQQVIEAQQASLRELSTPLIPISDRVVIMPLIGAIDSQRAQMVLETLLEGVAHHQAELVILDITGVSIVDTQVAQSFVQSAQAVRLLGADVMLTGIQPQIAQTMVHLGVDLRDMQTQSSLQAGIAAALS
jgi:anti-anti-sigma regulatory factor/HAMP domain-containing protein